MAQGIKVLATRPDHLSSIPGSQIVKGKGKELTPESCPLTAAHTQWLMNMYMHTHTHMHTHTNTKNVIKNV